MGDLTKLFWVIVVTKLVDVESKRILKEGISIAVFVNREKKVRINTNQELIIVESKKRG